MSRSPTPGKVAATERTLPPHLRADLITGHTRQPGTADPAIFYTDGSVSRHRIGRHVGWMTGWGYISTDGRYGCGKYPQFAGKVGDDPPLTTELRAIWHAIGEALTDGPLTVVTGSTRAAEVLAGWQGGRAALPGGYTGRRRGIPTLERLRQAVADHPGRLTVRHVKGHSGDVLNEAADTLALLGMRWARDDLDRDDVTRRAEGIADGFLADFRRRRR